MDRRGVAATRLAAPEEASAIKAASMHCRSVRLDARALCDLELLLSGAYPAVSGYLGPDDFESVLETLCLADGTPFPLPLSLDVPDALAERLELGETLALRDGEGFMLATLTVESLFRLDPALVARALFGTDDPHVHPGVGRFLAESHACRIGGRVRGLALPDHCDFTALRQTPAAVREELARRGCRRVLGYQPASFPHREDRAMLLEAAARLDAFVLLFQAAGDAMAPQSHHFAAVRCAWAFADQCPEASCLLTLLPSCPLGAGPRQALHEALLHKQYGCTHVLIAPHHGDPLAGTGAGSFYPPGAAQRLVAAFADRTGVAMVPRPTMLYVEERAQYVPARSVLPEETVRTLPAGEVRRRLEHGLEIPDWYAFPEVLAVLRQAFPPRSRQGLTIFMTGLSGAGKSTLAKLLYVKLMERGTRPVTLLDGDIVRHHLSSELTFSKAHRDLNIERIGYVASEITKNGGIAICAPIAPYAGARRRARAMVSRFGGFVEVSMATPLAVCEGRDCKGLYAKARAGLISGVTGIDDPYEVPQHAELVLDTTALSPTAALQDVLLYLERQGYLAP